LKRKKIIQQKTIPQSNYRPKNLESQSPSQQTPIETTIQTPIQTPSTSQSSSSIISNQNSPFPSIKIFAGHKMPKTSNDRDRDRPKMKSDKILTFVRKQSTKPNVVSPLIFVPHDVLLHIFSYLENLKDVVSCMLVCKYWHQCSTQGEAILFRSLVRMELEKNWNFALSSSKNELSLLRSITMETGEGSLKILPNFKIALNMNLLRQHLDVSNWRETLILLENRKKEWHPFSGGKPSIRHAFREEVRQVLVTENNEILTLVSRLGVIVW